MVLCFAWTALALKAEAVPSATRWPQPRATTKPFGRTWERQALLRARPAAGDLDLGGAFSGPSSPSCSRARRDRALGRSPLAAPAVRGQHPSSRLERKAGARRDSRRRAGGAGAGSCSTPASGLTCASAPPCRAAQAGLAGLLTAQEVRTLTGAYHLWRAVEHRIQLEQGAQTHELPAEPSGRERLARRLAWPATRAGCAGG